MGTGAIRLLLMVSLFVAPLSVRAAVVPGDYDGDGRSDLVVADIDNSSNQTAYRVRLSSTGAVDTYPFNFPADGFVPGTWIGGNTTLPGVTSPLSLPYVGTSILVDGWYVYSGLPQLIGATLMGQLATLVQGDFNCDGVTDVAVSRPEYATRSWEISFAGPEVAPIKFGLVTDRVFAADVDGDRCAEFVTIRVVNGAMIWESRKYNSSAKRTVIWGQLGDIPLKPLDMNGDGKPDYMAARSGGGSTVVFIRYSDTQNTSVAIGPEGVIPIAGNFTGANGFAYYNRNDGSFVIKTPSGDQKVALGSASSVVIRPDGTSVWPGQDERIASESPKTPVVVDPTANPGGAIRRGTSASKNPTRCDRYYKATDGNGNYVHNPKTSKGKFKAVLRPDWSNQVRDIRVVSKKKVIDHLKYAQGYEYGGRERWYSSKAPSKYPKNIVEVLEFQSGQQVCIKIADPRRRYD